MGGIKKGQDPFLLLGIRLLIVMREGGRTNFRIWGYVRTALPRKWRVSSRKKRRKRLGRGVELRQGVRE